MRLLLLLLLGLNLSGCPVNGTTMSDCAKACAPRAVKRVSEYSCECAP